MKGIQYEETVILYSCLLPIRLRSINTDQISSEIQVSQLISPCHLKALKWHSKFVFAFHFKQKECLHTV